MQLESFATQPLQQTVPAYVYAQFADDPDISAFFDAYNSLGQGYLDWFLQTPLSVYTSPNISGPLLDWIGQGIYGIQRPTISSITSKISGAYGTTAYGLNPYATRKVKQSGSVTILDDDIYKRVLTWHLYLGDGRQMSVQWLRRRVARFIFGANGDDIPADYLQQISISPPPSGFAAAFGTSFYGSQAYGVRRTKRNLTRHSIQIGVPNGQIGQIFSQLMSQGDLAVPFQIKFSVTFHGSGGPYLLDSTFILDQSTLA
jgi:hypothetical protein